MTEHGSGMGSSFSTIGSAEQSDLYERLSRADFIEVNCLLAWLQCRSPSRRALRGVSFTEVAPTEELSQLVLEVLQMSEFVVAGKANRSLLRAVAADKRSAWRSQDWILDPSLGGESAVLDATEMAVAGFVHNETSLADASEIWQILAIAECTSYLIAELEEHHLDGRWAGMAGPAIANIVERVPIAQAFYICWLGVRDVASAYLKYPNSRSTLGTTLRSSLEQKLGRAQRERWTLRSFNRHPLCPESALANVFSAAARLEDDYLHSIPSLERLATHFP
jgi:hypothetical protein